MGELPICLFEYIKIAISLFGYIKNHQWENSIDGLKIKLICCLDTNLVDVAPLCWKSSMALPFD